ncbi:lysozyme [Superficieibacter electus]|uniref:Lysozyme n=1 Tax=Superficieibacter electus TaxID=2022662 RepID=A0A2P5GPK5_9ENTR|nr:lysozyme [Superficieibacter electus]POP45219.1 lysozyme [Superficieibacter electus]POP48503.1 lysozyme [Superficieibacter electus]
MALQPLTISPAGIALIKKYQGLNLEQYQDESGLWVIGYGHMIACYENFAGPLTPETAEALLMLDIQRCQCLLQQCLEISLNQPQYDALVSLALSCGNEAFYQSAILRHINARDFGNALAEWEKAIVLNRREIASLTPQRQAECALFLQGGEVATI